MRPHSDSHGAPTLHRCKRFSLKKSTSPIVSTPGHYSSPISNGPSQSHTPQYLASSASGMTQFRTSPTGWWMEYRPASNTPGYSPVQYMAPPPTNERIGRPNIFDDDTNHEGLLYSPDPNASISCSLSPINDPRFVRTGLRRSASASITHQFFLPSAPAERVTVEPTSSTTNVSSLQPTKQNLFSNCGALIEERDAHTGKTIATYKCGLELGKGGFAKVFDFTDMHTFRTYACKVVDRSKIGRKGEAKVNIEIATHKRMNHPNILKLYRAFSDEFYHYILLERCYHKDLLKIANEKGVFAAHELHHILEQLTSAVEYMHSLNIIHRDIKLGNTMIDFNGNLKIGDFGFASNLNYPKERKIRMCGTPNYIAPEVLTCSKTNKGYGFEVDIWGLGVCMFILAFGHPPFEAKDIESTYERIMKVDYKIPSQTSVPGSCIDLIGWMLHKDPHKRPTPVQIRQSAFMRSIQPTTAPPRSLIPSPPPSTDTAFLRSTASPIVVCSAYAPTPGPAKYCTQREAVKECETRQDCATDYEVQRVLSEFMDKHRRTTVERGLVIPLNRNGAVQRLRRPPAPDVFFRSALFASKYGHGVLIECQGSEASSLVFNDRTKMIYTHEKDTVFYCARRHRRGAQPNEHRSCNESLRIFRNATVTLNAEHVGPTSENLDPYQAAAHKKLGIANFLFPYLNRSCSDPTIPLVCSTFKSRLCENPALFSATASRFEDDVSDFFVREVVMERMSNLCATFENTNLHFTVCRFSNLSFQVSIQSGPEYPIEIIPCTETPIVAHGEPWAMDLLLYSGFHMILGFENEHVRFYQSFRDLRYDSKRNQNGRIFFASGSSCSKQQVTLPWELLQLVCLLLKRVHCPSDIVDCLR